MLTHKLTNSHDNSRIPPYATPTRGIKSNKHFHEYSTSNLYTQCPTYVEGGMRGKRHHFVIHNYLDMVTGYLVENISLIECTFPTKNCFFKGIGHLRVN